MEVDIYEAKSKLSKLIQSLVDKTEDEIIISKNGKPLVSMKLINKTTNKRIGAAEDYFKGFDMSMEDFNSLDVSDLFE